MAGEPVAGSAPEAIGWIAIEQNGPYGRDALTESHFPSDIGQALAERLDGSGIKISLIRSAGSHADKAGTADARRVWVACTQPARVLLGKTTIASAADLLDFNFDALIAGDLSAVAPNMIRDREPLLLVCSHARRDVCCARLGRPIAVELANDPRWTQRVWESSHIGGHRFAPTAVQLPHGWVHGRLSHESAARVLEDAANGEVSLATARGRSSLTADAQAADLAVRVFVGVAGLDATRVTPGSEPGQWLVATADFRRFEVVVEPTTGAARSESCGKSPIPWAAPEVVQLREVKV